MKSMFCVSVALALFFFGCSTSSDRTASGAEGGDECTKGEVRECDCGGGMMGTQVCVDDGVKVFWEKCTNCEAEGNDTGSITNDAGNIDSGDASTADDSGSVSDTGGGCDCPSGCCDKSGVCKPGTVDTICGKGGGDCADCSADSNNCVNQVCEAQLGCKVNSDCPLGYICYEQKCVEGCNKDADCPQTVPKCRASVQPRGKCIECLADVDCKAIGTNYFCNNGTCEKVQPLCNPKCTAWEECGEDEVCHPREGYCNQDADCTKLDPSLLCDVNTHACVLPECVVDDDCTVTCIPCGGTCDSNKCQCIASCGAPLCATCTDTPECQPGLTCTGLLTKYCNTQCTTDADCGGKYCYTWISTCQCPNETDAGVEVDAGLDSGEPDVGQDAGTDGGCAGCTAFGYCLPGDSNYACGTGGVECVQCQSGQICTNGQCQ
ncbi:MAG: hypothetical protein HY897_05325 [Deltaproteobacteria bacterium]|nr:hypothetical protein [Deltaproteobacteria bacterium]